LVDAKVAFYCLVFPAGVFVFGFEYADFWLVFEGVDNLEATVSALGFGVWDEGFVVLQVLSIGAVHDY